MCWKSALEWSLAYHQEWTCRKCRKSKLYQFRLMCLRGMLTPGPRSLMVSAGPLRNRASIRNACGCHCYGRAGCSYGARNIRARGKNIRSTYRGTRRNANCSGFFHIEEFLVGSEMLEFARY